MKVHSLNATKFLQNKIKTLGERILFLQEQIDKYSEEKDKSVKLRKSFQDSVDIINYDNASIKPEAQEVQVSLPNYKESPQHLERKFLPPDVVPHASMPPENNDTLSALSSRGKAILNLFSDRTSFTPEDVQAIVVSQDHTFTRMKAYAWIGEWKRKSWIVTLTHGNYKPSQTFLNSL